MSNSEKSQKKILPFQTVVQKFQSFKASFVMVLGLRLFAGCQLKSIMQSNIQQFSVGLAPILVGCVHRMPRAICSAMFGMLAWTLKTQKPVFIRQQPDNTFIRIVAMSSDFYVSKKQKKAGYLCLHKASNCIMRRYLGSQTSCLFFLNLLREAAEERSRRGKNPSIIFLYLAGIKGF